MDDVLIALGDNIFYAVHPSFETFKNELELDWHAQRRLSRRPALQFLGPGEESLTLNGVLYPERFGNGEDLLAGLRADALAGNQLPLIEIDESTLIGTPLDDLFVITKIGNTKEQYGVAGPRKISFDLELKCYGSDMTGFGGGLF